MSTYMCVYTYLNVSAWCLTESEEGIRSLGTGVKQMVLSYHVDWGTELGPLGAH